MSAIIDKIIPNSIADELELSQGDIVVAINENILKDYLDYQFEIQSEVIDLHIKRKSGEEEIIEIEKDFDEDLGIVFESAVFDNVKACTNKCVFCFIDQQPKGFRDSLYIKDDDYRLSYLQGTYVTLTNLKPEDKLRIEALSLGPLYVSVHTTNPDLRVKMLKNPRAANILDDLKWLNSINIPIHAQIVLCPGINDGVELERTLKDLFSLKSNVQSIAIVPVGVTKFRQGNLLKQITKQQAIETIKLVNEFNRTAKANIAFCSDEFYFVAGKHYPMDSYYNGYAQLEDGIGTSRLVIDSFDKFKNTLPKSVKKYTNATILTGTIAAESLSPIVEYLNQIENFDIEIRGVENKTFGSSVTVAGLLTANDLNKDLNEVKSKNIIIPSVMLRPYTQTFLDDITIDDLSSKFDKEFIVIDDYYSSKGLVDFALASS